MEFLITADTSNEQVEIRRSISRRQVLFECGAGGTALSFRIYRTGSTRLVALFIGGDGVLFKVPDGLERTAELRQC